MILVNAEKQYQKNKRERIDKDQETLKAFFKYQRNLPARLVKQFGYKNAFFDPNPQWTNRAHGLAEDEGRENRVMVEEIPLKVSKQGNQAINEMVKKRQNYIIKKNDFHSQRRALEKCTLKDLQEMFPISGGQAFEESCAMVKRTELQCQRMNQYITPDESTTMVTKGQAFLPMQEPSHNRSKKAQGLGSSNDKLTTAARLNSQSSKVSINEGESQKAPS